MVGAVAWLVFWILFTGIVPFAIYGVTGYLSLLSRSEGKLIAGITTGFILMMLAFGFGLAQVIFAIIGVVQASSG